MLKNVICVHCNYPARSSNAIDYVCVFCHAKCLVCPIDFCRDVFCFRSDWRNHHVSHLLGSSAASSNMEGEASGIISSAVLSAPETAVSISLDIYPAPSDAVPAPLVVVSPSVGDAEPSGTSVFGNWTSDNDATVVTAEGGIDEGTNSVFDAI